MSNLRRSRNGAGQTFWTLAVPELHAPGGLEITTRSTAAGLDFSGELVPWNEFDAAMAAVRVDGKAAAPPPDVAALLTELDDLPNPARCLLTHNERELIDFCNRLGAALRSRFQPPEKDGLAEAMEGLMP